MASDRQIQANRENARRSTGPRTPLGKVRSSINAVKHGLSARNAVLPEEDQQAYQELEASLDAEFQPQGPIENFLVQQMASAQWRLLRLARIETGFLMAGMDEIRNPPPDPYHPARPRKPKPEKTLSEDQQVTRLLGELFNRQCGGDAFARLARYENMLNAEYFRALRTLTAHQNARNKTNPIVAAVGQAVSPAEPKPRPSRPAPHPIAKLELAGCPPNFASNLSSTHWKPAS